MKTTTSTCRSGSTNATWAYSKASTAASHLARQFDGVAEVLHAFAAADWRLAAGGWRLAAGGWRLAAGGWRLAAGELSRPSRWREPPLSWLSSASRPPRCARRNGIGRGKSAPDPILLALIDLGADPADALYVGDMAVDQEAARRAGISYVHAGWGYGTPSPPTPVVAESPKDLLRLMDTGPILEGSLV